MFAFILPLLLAAQPDSAIVSSNLGPLTVPFFTRSRLGFIQLNDNGSVAQSVNNPVLRARDFGTRCDGITDDSAALQAAFTAAFNQKRPLELDGCTYEIYSELVNQGIELRGHRGIANTVIAANAAVPSVMHVTGVTNVSDIEFEGQYVATYTINLDGTSRSRFHNVAADGAVFDGWHLSNGHGNDFVQLDNCLARLNGTIYVSTGRAASSSAATKFSLGATRVDTTTGSTTITRSAGSTDFTTLGIRPGDFIGVGADAAHSDWVQIVSVTSSTITVNDGYQAATLQTRVSQPFAIFVGDGYHEEPSGDNNRNHITAFYAANNAGSGMTFHGLYGPTVHTVQLDGNGAYPIEVGLYGGSPSAAPQGTLLDSVYSEGLTEIPRDAEVFASNCNGLEVHNTNVIAFANGSVRTANPSVCYGTISMDSALPEHVYPIGSMIDDVPSSVLEQGAQVNGPVYQKWNDSSAAPGNVDLTGFSYVACGKAAIASGTSTMRITHSLMTANDALLITPESIDATLTQWKAVCSAGHCDVTGNANATNTFVFNWQFIRRN